MATLLGVSPLQIMGLWEQLMMAYYGQHSYGSSVAEIYLYTVMDRDPWVEINRKSSEATQAYAEANQRLHDLCRLFEQRMECTLLIDGDVTLNDMIADPTDPNRHRWHIEVKREGLVYDHTARGWVTE